LITHLKRNPTGLLSQNQASIVLKNYVINLLFLKQKILF